MINKLTPDFWEEIRKPYDKPEIVHELELETRAGSPLGFPDELDIFEE